MKNNFRTHNFTNTSDAKFDALKSAVQGHTKDVFNLAIEMGLPIKDKKEGLANVLKLSEILFEGLIERTKVLNNTMNKLADYANDNGIEICPEMIFKIQAFIDSVCSMDFIDSFYKLKVSNPMVTLEDLCKSYSKTISNALTELSSGTNDENKYQSVMNMMEQDRPVEEVVGAFRSTLNDIPTEELCFLIDKIGKIQNLKVLMPFEPGPQFVKVDTIMSKILLLCKDELDRRRASN
jgi:hypothetical protein